MATSMTTPTPTPRGWLTGREARDRAGQQGEAPLLTPLHDDISILTILLALLLLLLASIGWDHRVEQERFDVRIDGRGLVVGQKKLNVGEHGVRKNVVFPSGGVTNQTVVHQLVAVTRGREGERERERG